MKMVYSKEKWIAAYKKAVSDLNTSKPTSGLPCAVASIRYLRDGLLDDMGEPKDESEKAFVETVRECFSELLREITKKDGKGVEDGFLSNASAAAKSAGFKTVLAEITSIGE